MTEVLRLREQALEWRDLEGEFVVLDLRREEYLRVNRPGAGLWSLLAKGASRVELARHLVETYGVAQAAAEEDADAFVADLAARRLLEPVS